MLRAAPGDEPDRKPILTQQLAVLILVATTLLAYANAWPDSLTFDDRLFADSSRFAGIGLADLPRFFTEDLWAASGFNSDLYRPLVLLWISLQASVFGDWLAGYHLVNILLHVLATVLVYAFVGHLLLASGSQPSVSRLVALLAAVVFGVHTIHTEVVNSIFNSSEILVTIGVVGGLWWFLRTRGAEPVKAWLGLGLVYLLILLCRESAAALPALTVAMICLADPDPWLARLRKCIPVVWLLAPLGIYLVLRTHALDSPAVADGSVTGLLEQASPLPDLAAPAPQLPVEAGVDPLAQLPAAAEVEPQLAQQAAPLPDLAAPAPQLPVEAGVDPLAQLPAATGAELAPQLPAAAEVAPQKPVGPENSWASVNLSDYVPSFRQRKFLPAVHLWFESLKTMLWPYPLQIYYDKPASDIRLAAVAQALVLCVGIVVYIKKRPLLLVGLAFFYLAILPSSQLFGDTRATPGLADRILYMPSVGLTIVLAAGLVLLVRRFGQRSAVLAVLVISLFLVPLTWARNAQWASDSVLAESTYARLKNKEVILNTLIAAHLRENNLGRATEICDAHADDWRAGLAFGAHCGGVYAHLGRFGEAEKAYLSASDHPDSKVYAHMNLAILYLHLGRRADAIEQFERTIAAEKLAFLRHYFSAVMLIQMYPTEKERLLEARAYLERALQMQPQHLDSRNELDQLNARLAASHQ